MQFGVFAFLLAGLLAYSQTLAFHWDEGFHLLAAQFISHGKRPYLDFIFAQVPLNAYWNAAWFHLFFPSWRLAQALAALETWLAVVLMARYLLARFPAPEWRRAAALVSTSLFGLLVLTFTFGAIAQAYGFCLLMLVAAFRVVVVARDRASLWLALLAGCLAGCAVSASLLTAAAAPAMLLWLWIYNGAGNRWSKSIAFAAGAVLPAIPVLRFLAEGPRQVWFDLVQYHAIYRRADWPGATPHDIDVLSSWLQDTQQLLFLGLTVAGWLFFRRSRWQGAERSEFRLCLWLALAIGAQNVVAHPTFPQYFVFVVPFLTLPAAIGLYAAVKRLHYPGPPERAALALGCFMLLSLGRSLFYNRDANTWHPVVAAANKVDQVTPPGAALLAPEQIYFLTLRTPPPGLEFGFGQKLDFGPKRNALLHILPRAEVERQGRAGRFATAAVCDDDDQVERINNWNVYKQRADLGECTVFWQLAPAVK